MSVNAKMIRTLAPAGTSINFMSICGNSIFDYPCPVSMIKTMIERGIRVYEQLDTPAEDGSTEVLLTLENYDKDNGGVEVPEDAIIIPDIELEVANTHAEEYAELLVQKGKAIKEKQTYESNVFLGLVNPLNPDIIIESGSASSITIESGSASSIITGPIISGGEMMEEEGEL